MRETFPELFNSKLESLKFDNVEDWCNNFRKIVRQVADVALRKKVRKAVRNISENALSLAEQRRGL